MRRWWLTIVLNLVIVLSIVSGCVTARNGASTEGQVAAIAPDSTYSPLLLARDKRNPIERQDHFGWKPPYSAAGEAVYYVVEYQRRDLMWAIAEARRASPPSPTTLTWVVEQAKLDEMTWRRLGTTATNTVWIPQRYTPYRVRVTAYFAERLWVADKSAGFGPVSVPSEWVEQFINR